ncbi:MAG: tyrosine-type recombinase/integrase, partial [Chloroflexota bacterium]
MRLGGRREHEAIRPGNVIRAFKALLARVGLPRTIRVHDPRHTAATALRVSGTDLATTALILGHASPQVTATVYTHLLPPRSGRSRRTPGAGLPAGHRWGMSGGRAPIRGVVRGGGTRRPPSDGPTGATGIWAQRCQGADLNRRPRAYESP